MNTYRVIYTNRSMVLRIEGDIEAAYLHCKLKWGLADFVELFKEE